VKVSAERRRCKYFVIIIKKLSLAENPERKYEVCFFGCFAEKQNRTKGKLLSLLKDLYGTGNWSGAPKKTHDAKFGHELTITYIPLGSNLET
jgi:hypothetical protein